MTMNPGVHFKILILLNSGTRHSLSLYPPQFLALPLKIAVFQYMLIKQRGRREVKTRLHASASSLLEPGLRLSQKQGPKLSCGGSSTCSLHSFMWWRVT